MAVESKVKFKNAIVITGTIVDMDLEKVVDQVSAAGNKYTAIRGTVAVDTGDNNIHTMRLFYSPTFGDGGKPNPSFGVADRWLREAQSAEEAGMDNPVIGSRVKFTPSFANNIFPSNGELINTYQISGGFVETNPQRLGSDKAEFSADVLITSDLVPEIVNEEETGRFFLNAETADYRGMLFPVRFVIEGSGGINYLEGLDKPTIIEIWGDVLNVVTKTTKTTENAFGEAHVEEVSHTTRENLIKGASTESREITDLIEEGIKAGRQMLNAKVAQEEEKMKNAGGNAFKGAAAQGAAKASGAEAKKGTFTF